MRIQVDISASKAIQIKRLMTLADFKNYAELFNNAVALAQWAGREVQDGLVIAAFDKRRNKLKELTMPFLQHIADQSDEKGDDSSVDYVDPEELLEEAHATIARQEAQIEELKRRVENVPAVADASHGAGGD